VPHGVFGPGARTRADIVAAAASTAEEPSRRHRRWIRWAAFIERVFQRCPASCPTCGEPVLCWACSTAKVAPSTSWTGSNLTVRRSAQAHQDERVGIIGPVGLYGVGAKAGTSRWMCVTPMPAEWPAGRAGAAAVRTQEPTRWVPAEGCGGVARAADRSAAAYRGRRRPMFPIPAAYRGRQRPMFPVPLGATRMRGSGDEQGACHRGVWRRCSCRRIESEIDLFSCPLGSSPGRSAPSRRSSRTRRPGGHRCFLR
jgi:hypothetical protein